MALSAVTYGPAFMAVSALLAIWSYQTFPDRPTAGFSATVFFLGAGTIAGPAMVGVIAERHGLRAAPLLAAVVALLTVLVRMDRSRTPSRYQHLPSPRSVVQLPSALVIERTCRLLYSSMNGPATHRPVRAL
ncbi:hypothetical protein [Phytoactinopolyspora alkaliphila]|uniref:hypothetical protein n=1 Tax=Phytoactinopolyspora alkaliphila TaxID=1783498 RepID=UPI001C2086B2|nr:hypothetical protein [Phytoactinopolyspora alkaliphila]